MGFCEFTKAYRIYIPTLWRAVTSRDLIIDETKGYNVDIPNPHAEPVLESQLDLFAELVNETEGKNDDIPVELNDKTHIEPHVGKEIQPDPNVGENEILIV